MEMESLYSFFPARKRWPSAIADVSEADPESESVRLVSGATNLGALASLSSLRSLWCFDINGPGLATICQCGSLETLHIENLKTDDLHLISRLTNLKVLSLDTCSKVRALDVLSGFQWLTSLAIIHFKNVHDLAPLAKLTGLHALAVAGSTWTRMQVDSFEPLAELKDLRLIHLTNIKAKDESLKPLAGLCELKRIDIANFYPMREFALLSRALTETECTWFKPWIGFDQGVCKKCGSQSLVMLTGKGKSMLCRQCDHRRLQKHMDSWNEAVARAA